MTEIDRLKEALPISADGLVERLKNDVLSAFFASGLSLDDVQVSVGVVLELVHGKSVKISLSVERVSDDEEEG